MFSDLCHRNKNRSPSDNPIIPTFHHSNTPWPKITEIHLRRIDLVKRTRLSEVRNLVANHPVISYCSSNMAKNPKEIVIPKEKAVFRLDKHGYWHNEHGKFQHKKIIDYFHTCIEKDADGYYLSQERDNYKEKVYFPYEETAYFVFKVSKNNDDVILTLNTKKQIKLNPKNLFIKDDDLYMTVADDLIKFTEHSLIRISDLLEFEEDKYFIRLNDKRYAIKKR